MIRSFFPALWVGLLLVGAASLVRAEESEIPEALRDQALSISIRATVAGGREAASWESLGIRNTVPGSPVGIKLQGSNVVIVFQLTPFQSGKTTVNLVTQGQVWVKKENGEISYRTTLDSMSVRYGERVLYFPLGQDGHGLSPLVVEILIEPYASEAGKALRLKQGADHGVVPAGSQPPPPPPASADKTLGLPSSPPPEGGAKK